MHPAITRWQRDYARAQRMRWIMKAQERREAVDSYFPLGGRRSLALFAAVAVVFFVVRMWP